MAAKELKTVPKITVKIWRPLLSKLEARIEDACIRRDAYLAKLLETELPYLDAEVSLPNSVAAQRHVATCLDGLDRKSVSLALPTSLVDRLNEICRRKRIARDAFFNRLFLLLAAEPSQVDDLLFGGDAKVWKRYVWDKFKGDLESWQDEFYPLQAQRNPFWALREGWAIYEADLDQETYAEPETGKEIRVIKSATGEIEPIPGIYTVFFDRRFTNGSLFGLNCYVPDWRVPGHASATEHLRRTQEFDALWAD